MHNKGWRYVRAVMLTTLTMIGTASLSVLTNIKILAQTPSVQSQCTDVEIKKHIQQLNKGELADFNALVACKSKAVPALIKALKNLDDNLRIIAITALGEIGSEAAPAVPILNKLLKDKNQDVRTITVHALRQIGKDPVPPLINALKNQDSNVRVDAANTLGQFGTEAKEAIPALTIALKDPDIKVRSAATSALGQINKDKLSTQNNYECVAVAIRANNCVNSSPLNLPINTTTTRVGQDTVSQLRANPPVMCKIPIIRSVLKWKCP